MQNNVNYEQISKQIQIITKEDNNYVLYNDYKKLIDQISNTNNTIIKQDNLNLQNSNDFLEIDSQLQTAKNEANYYKKQLKKSSLALEQELEKVIQLQENCNEIRNLYLITLEEKQKIQKQVQKAIEQRDYAEGELIKKALDFSKHQDELNNRIEQFQQKQNLFEKEKKEFEQKRNDYIQQSLQNSNIKRKTTFDFSTTKDDFLEVKMVLKKQKGVLLHPDNNKNQKNYYNIMACSIDSSQRYLSTTGMDKRILITDISKNFSIVCEFQNKYIQNVSCFDDKRGLLITGGQNNDISFYQIKNQKKTGTFKNHQDQINVLKVTENNSLISGSQDRTIKTWDLKKMRLIGSKMFPSVTLCLDVNSNMVFSGHQDGTLKINSQNTNKNIYQSNLFENGYLNFCEYYSTTNSLLISSRNRLIKVFDLRMMSVRKEFSLQNFDIFDGPKKMFAADHSLQNLYCGTNSGELKEFDISGKIFNLRKSIKITDQPLNLPYIINANLHDSLLCVDYEGRITQARFISEFG